MEKNQRCLAKAAKRGKGNNSNRMPTDANEGRSIDAAGMKQEQDIKVQPQPIGNLATVSAQSLDNRGGAEALIENMESEEEEEHVKCPFDDDVKIEVKNECDKAEKKEKELKAADEDEVNSEQNGHALDNDTNSPVFKRNGTNELDEKKPNKIKAKGKAAKQHQCTQCQYVAACKSHLEIHLLKHTGKNPFACKHCSKAFARKENLKGHMKVHVKDFLFNCSVCLQGFDRKKEKTEHESNCMALRYECHLCKKSFGTMKSNLIRHMPMHSGERAFDCKECFKLFTRKCNLNEHMNVHAGPRPFRCSKCLQSFSQQNECNEHEQKCHRRTFQCYACGKAFGLNKRNLERHMRTHVGDKPFACTKCLKKFADKSYFNRHINGHSRSLPWKCAICRKGFTKPAQCKAHQCRCSRRGYECHLCKKFFGLHLLNLKMHILTHTGEKPFKCEICQNQFTRKGNLKQHLKAIHNKKYK